MTGVILAVLNGYAILPSMNHTFVALTLKKQKPDSITDFRPIILCNVSYKVVKKVIANRLKGMLSSIISESQAAFTARRLITYNILVAFGIFHAMNEDTSVVGSIAIELDMAKAYDGVE